MVRGERWEVRAAPGALRKEPRIWGSQPQSWLQNCLPEERTLEYRTVISDHRLLGWIPVCCQLLRQLNDLAVKFVTLRNRPQGSKSLGEREGIERWTSTSGRGRRGNSQQARLELRSEKVPTEVTADVCTT